MCKLPNKNPMENKKIRTIRILAASVFVVCMILTGWEYGQSLRHRAQQDSLKEMTDETAVQDQMESSSVLKDTGATTLSDPGTEHEEDSGKQDEKTPKNTVAQEPAMLDKYVELYAENNDLAGWLSIAGMKIDYPVMQNKDNEYYLHRDFYGNDSKYGCLYVRARADLDTGTNFIVYGHNMKDGAMFGDLDAYLAKSFYEEHSLISFHTLYEERVYEIIAVFRSQVYNTDDDVFKYYQFYEADTQEDFDSFYNNIKELSLYDTGVEARFGDTFLTLSTCAYHVKDGRFVVVAKRVA